MLYDAGLRDALGSDHIVRSVDGRAFSLDLPRYLGPSDDADERLLDGLRGPVLDVGCGPGRQLHALARRGIFALGVDLSPVAVALAVAGGGRAIVADVFGELPGVGTWQSALLLDGNIGIGGSPARLLARLAALLAPGGVVIAELGRPGSPTGPTHVRLERGPESSGWFKWAWVAASSIVPLAEGSGFSVAQQWSTSDRWFARLVREPASARPA